MARLSWLEFIQILWPIASVITPVLLATGLMWLRTQFATKAEMAARAADLAAKQEAHGKAIDDHETRLRLIEQDAGRPPTRHELYEKMSDVAGRTGAIEASLEGLEKQVGTLNEYLRTIIERDLNK